MIRPQEIPWKRITAEGAAIVVSILLAFWIDAWWDEREQRDDERIILQSLYNDLNQKRSLLNHQRHSVEAKLESAIKLLRAATDKDQVIAEDSIDRVIGDLLWFESGADWESAPINTVVMSGDMKILSNALLQQELADLQISITRFRADADDGASFYWNYLVPFLSRNANLAQIFDSTEHEPGFPEFKYYFPELDLSSPRDHSLLLSNEEFQGLIAAKIDIELGHLRTIRSRKLDEQLDEIILMLEEELANGR